MGIAVLFILAPALALTMPQVFEDFNPFSSSETTDSDYRVILAAEEDPQALIEPPSPTASVAGVPEAAATAPQAPLPTDSEEAADTTTTSEASSASDETQPESSPTTEPKSSSPTTKPTSPTTTKPSSPTTKPSSPTTTSPPSPTTTEASSPVVTGTITGTACPCTVTGTVELKGNISLQGDLMVMGGTLVARPGVNLDGNGHQIMFMNGGKADFRGSEVFTWSGNGSNANVSRDINFSNLQRIMFHQGAGKSVLKYFAVKNSGTGSLGDYSLHWHLNGNSTRGTIVEGVAVVGSKNHAFVPHGSHGITFRHTIAKNGKCDAYWWDPPEFQSTSQVNNSNDIVYDHALADGVTNCIGDNRGTRLSAFELGAGKGNVVKNSVARNVKPSHPKDCSGFQWPELNNKQPSSWTFTNNASYGSACNGIFVWQNDSEQHIINGFKGDGIDHGAYRNDYDYRNVDVEFVEIHALGWTLTGGKIDTVIAMKHRIDDDAPVFTDVAIDKFIIRNAQDSGDLATTYVFNNTGLKCSDVVWDNVVPGTKVKIDGSNC